MSRTQGKTITSIEFDDPLLDLLREICAVEESSLSRLVRIACTGFALDYVKNHEDKWAKARVELDEHGEPQPRVTIGHINEAARSDEAIPLALAALTGKSESSMYPERNKATGGLVNVYRKSKGTNDQAFVGQPAATRDLEGEK